MRTTRPRRTNQQWLEDLRAGGRRRDEALVDLRGFLRGVLGKTLRGRRRLDDAALDDFVQDALLKVLDHLDDFRGDSRFTTWASAVAVRTALGSLRRAHWRDVSLDEVFPGPDALAATDDPSSETRLHRRQLLEAIARAIRNDLTEKRRTAILGELAGVPHAVLAERLDIAPNALYKLSHDARRRLRASLEREGFTAEDVRTAFDASSKEPA